MSLDSVRDFLAARAPDVSVVPLERGSETFSLSAAWNVKPAQIAKSLVLRAGERNLLLLACGDSRLDNKKVKAAFGGKAKMLPPEEAAALTGHPVGGVCPFGLATPLPVYCDVMLQAYREVVLGAGATHAALRIATTRMAELAGAQWVDVCEGSR